MNLPNQKSSAVNLEKLDYTALKQLLVDVAEKVETRRRSEHYGIGVTYKDPSGNGTWIGGTRGRQPPWLRELFQNLIGDEQIVKKYQPIAVST